MGLELSHGFEEGFGAEPEKLIYDVKEKKENLGAEPQFKPFSLGLSATTRLDTALVVVLFTAV